MPYQRPIRFGVASATAHQCQERAQQSASYFNPPLHRYQMHQQQQSRQQQPSVTPAADTNQGYGQAMMDNYGTGDSKYELYSGEAVDVSQNFPRDPYEYNNQLIVTTPQDLNEEVSPFYQQQEQVLLANPNMMNHQQAMAYDNNRSIPVASYSNEGVTFPITAQSRQNHHYDSTVSSYSNEQQFGGNAPTIHYQPQDGRVQLSYASRRRQPQQPQFSYDQSAYSTQHDVDGYEVGDFPTPQTMDDSYVQYRTESQSIVTSSNNNPPPPPSSLDEIGTSTYSVDSQQNNLQFCTPSSGLVLTDEAHLLDDSNLPHMYHLPTDIDDDSNAHHAGQIDQCQLTAPGHVAKMSATCQLVAPIHQEKADSEFIRSGAALSSNDESLIRNSIKTAYNGNCNIAKPNGQIEAQQTQGSLFMIQTPFVNNVAQQSPMTVNNIKNDTKLDQVEFKSNNVTSQRQAISDQQQDYIDMRSSGSLSQDWLDTICRHMIEHMDSFGICVIDNFLGSLKGDMILEEVQRLYSNRNYTKGRLVNDKLESEGASGSGTRSLSATTAGSNQLAKKQIVETPNTIRNDRVIWVDGCEDGCEEINNLIQTLCSVITNSSRLSLYSNNRLDKIVINKRTKAHVACYPGNGTRYIKHVDNPNGDGRVITAIYYLNKGWNTGRDGGLLRMFPVGMDEVANIEPLFDRVLFFWSDRRNPHEVLPAYRDRFAITVWYIGESRVQ